MKIHKICFSPTGGTRRVSEILTKVLSDDSVRVDLTRRDTDFGGIVLSKEDLALISVPSCARPELLTGATRPRSTRASAYHA